MLATILIVDDEPLLLRAMQRQLGRLFNVLPASSVEAALTALTDEVKVVLTDFSMPDGDGLALATALRARGYAGAIAVLSAVVETKPLDDALAAGVIDALIAKPWRGAPLVEQVQRLSQRRGA